MSEQEPDVEPDEDTAPAEDEDTEAEESELCQEC